MRSEGIVALGQVCWEGEWIPAKYWEVDGKYDAKIQDNLLRPDLTGAILTDLDEGKVKNTPMLRYLGKMRPQKETLLHSFQRNPEQKTVVEIVDLRDKDNRHMNGKMGVVIDYDKTRCRSAESF